MRLRTSLTLAFEVLLRSRIAPTIVAVMKAARLPPPDPAMMIGLGQSFMSGHSLANCHCLTASSIDLAMAASTLDPTDVVEPAHQEFQNAAGHDEQEQKRRTPTHRIGTDFGK